MADYYWCQGLTYDEEYREKECPRRASCQFYDPDIYAKYKLFWAQFDVLIYHHPCTHYLPKCKTRDI